MAARASRLENQDAIDTAIVSMLADPKEVHAATVQLLVSSSLNNLKNVDFYIDLGFSALLHSLPRYPLFTKR